MKTLNEVPTSVLLDYWRRTDVRGLEWLDEEMKPSFMPMMTEGSNVDSVVVLGMSGSGRTTLQQELLMSALLSGKAARIVMNKRYAPTQILSMFNAYTYETGRENPDNLSFNPVSSTINEDMVANLLLVMAKGDHGLRFEDLTKAIFDVREAKDFPCISDVSEELSKTKDGKEFSRHLLPYCKGGAYESYFDENGIQDKDTQLAAMLINPDDPERLDDEVAFRIA